MKRWKRRVFFVFAIAIFLMMAPLAILYTSGYRYNFSDKSLKKIGMVIIESTPEDVNVYINDQLVTDKTPYKQSSVFPDTYNIKLTKDDYTTWEKNLTVESKLVTWVSHARIFLLDPPAKIVAQKSAITNFVLAPDYKKIAYVAPGEVGSELWLADIDSAEQKKLFPSEQATKQGSISNLEWSPDSRKVLFNSSSQYFIVDAEKSAESKAIPGSDLEKLSWDTQDSDFVYYLQQGKLVSANISMSTEPTVIAQNVVDYEVRPRSIFYLKQKPDENGLTICNITKNKIEQESQPTEISQLPGNSYILKVSPNNKLALLADNKSLFLINEGEFSKLKDGVLNFTWTKKDEGLVFHTENEIWFYKATEDDESAAAHSQYNLNKTNLLTRYSTKIDLATWYPDEEHIIFATNNKLYIKELDSRDQANGTELVTDFLADRYQQVFTDKKGQKIYYRDKEGKSGTIVEKEIY
ncbi:MAG: PEGA domain-containing protein [Parcubacteria group bacterium]|nr:PEGA domain-containing protein [Parcubacteria group bacterium]